MAELAGCNVDITFLHPAGELRTTVSIKVIAPTNAPPEVVDHFAIGDCLEILNRIIDAYQATTEEAINGGFIFPLGVSDMQLFAEIHVDGRDIRDRWPSHRGWTGPLGKDEADEFERYLVGDENLPLAKLLMTRSALSLERGEYTLAVIQAATAVELRATETVSNRLKEAGWSDAAIAAYERGLTLGGKLDLPRTDPRSLETYFDGVDGFAEVLQDARSRLVELRNNVVHRGHLASPRQEAVEVVTIAHTFLRVVS